MKRKFLTMFLALAASLCLCFGLAACGAGFSVEGTYYLVEHDEYDMKTYFILKGGKWTDEDGVSGDYEISGEKITLYTDIFGEKAEFTGGTLKDGVLTVEGVFGNKVFAKEGAWKGASGGSQTPAAKEYTVTYNANGGAFLDGDSTFKQTIKEGEKLTAPTSPTRKNFSFAGWAKSKNGSDMWKFDEDAVSSDITLWATWTQESAVILSVEGASIDGREIFMLVGHTTGEVSLSNMVVCSDDSIWRLYSDPEGQREIPTKIVTNLKNGDNKYYIVVNSQNQAQVNVYTLTVHRSYLVAVSYYDGERLLETAETYTGDEFTANYKPDFTGYTFNGWKKGGSAFTSAVLWAPLSLYADKTANTYKVTLDVNNGDALSETEKTLTYDQTYSLPVPKRTGYSFTGWYVGSTQITNANGSSLSEWKYASAQNVTAHWQGNNYAVTLKQNDSDAGTVSGGGDHAYGSQVTITATTNNGYNFLGWYDKNDNLVSDKAQYTFKMGFAVSYTAKWDITHYTLTFVYDSTVGDAENIPKGYTIRDLPLTLPKLIGKNDNKHISVGWMAKDGTEYTNEIPRDTTGNLTLTVIWGVTGGAHSWQADHTCSVCGARLYIKSGDGTKIYFGEYPQSEVKESGLKGFLGMEAGANPTSSNKGKWTDYGYYIGGSVSSYMWYIDVEYQDNRYRGVYFTSYRPYYTMRDSSTGNSYQSYQDDNGYNTDTVYWFKYEPIEWRVLEQKDGTALLMANIILDSQQYYRTDSGTRTVGGKTVYPNNYKESDIRAWLNETFYETAFDQYAQEIIETTTVDNSASSTATDSNSYACENTQDKVFLLSYKEATTSSYGLNTTTRQLKSTDYAKSQGVYVNASYGGRGEWWLRSPYSNGSSNADYVRDVVGTVSNYGVNDTRRGVVPALRIRL